MRELRKSELCPLHKSYYCCGRENPRRDFKNSHGQRKSSGAVRIVEDQFHPRGYREVISKSEQRRRKLKLCEKIKECFYCHKPLETFSDTDLAHIEPKGMGGARHDDHWDNLTLAHRRCNNLNGSKRPAA